MSEFVLALDQGTTSTRAMVFDGDGMPVATAQLPHRQYTPAPGWVEHDPIEIWVNAREVIGQALGRAGLTRHDIAAVGITNQRETTVLWDRRTGRPLARAIVWQDVRTDALVGSVKERIGEAELRRRTGLPLSSYFSVTKLLWLLEHVPGARSTAAAGHLMFGTMDTWLLWNLSGGPDGGAHATDVTNASRTALMDLRTLAWDREIVEALDIPESLLPEIRPSISAFARAEEHSLLRGVPITAVIGDQQASLFAHGLSRPGDVKCTYGTGGFVMMHTGEQPVESRAGLIPTVASQRAGDAATYALEGSIAVAGSLLQWLRDRMGVLQEVTESEPLARRVDDSGGVYIVPAFSGLFAPHWRADARGTIVGLTGHTDRAHLVRAALDAIAQQVSDVVEAAQEDSGLPIAALHVDGGAAANGLLMQIQADLLGVPVERPPLVEMTALGAALAARAGAGMSEERRVLAHPDRWRPTCPPQWRAQERVQWRRAVERSLGWVA